MIEIEPFILSKKFNVCVFIRWKREYIGVLKPIRDYINNQFQYPEYGTSIECISERSYLEIRNDAHFNPASYIQEIQLIKIKK